MIVKSCPKCGWPATLNMHPGETFGTVPDHDDCPVCGTPLTSTEIDETMFVSKP